jgi:uncharacterized protein YceK
MPIRFRIVLAWPAIALCLLMVGCSSVQAIADGLAATHERATAIERAATGIAAEAAKPEPDLPAIVHAASQIASDARSIQSEVSSAQGHLGGVENRESQWALALKWGGIAAAIVALVVLLAWSGALVPIRKAFYALGLFIPEATKSSALLAAKANIEGTTPRHEQQIAADRASDPAFNAAYRQAERRLRKAATPSEKSP